jgi:eukaryotic-like serine/threonine-protein kinase
MTLTAGTKLGPYEILSPLGAGGMGEVYRAKDTKLGRDVALKVLQEEFFEDQDRVARFEREARSLAALNHPGIAAIYAFEEIAGRHLLVMELADGEGLDARIGRGAIPVEEAVSIGRQIAEALEAAHEKGIVHRDLKPANVKVSPDGKVKLLDFGLAKAWEGDPGKESASGLTQSPTLTARATAAGMILGTAAYMSPEQARGKPVDKRADIWAFGVVLWEMLTGRRLFEGETVSDVLAAVLRAEPDWAALPEQTPGKIRDLLRKCLRRDAKLRLRDIGDARLDLEELGTAGASSASGRSPFEEKPAVPDLTAGSTASAASARGSRKSLYLSWAIAAAFAAVAGVAGVLALRVRAPQAAASSPGLVRFDVNMPERTTLGLSLAVSPDGRQVAFTALTADEASGIWVRQLSEGAPRPIRGTENGRFPFWSPDGRSLGFFAGGKLVVVEVATGILQTLCEAPEGRGGTWGAGDAILFAPSTRDPLWRVSARGGKPVPVTELSKGEKQTSHRWPFFLPDGKRFIFVAMAASDEGKGVFLSRPGAAKPRRLAGGVGLAQWVEPGGLLTVRNNRLVFMPMDPESDRSPGAPVVVAEGLDNVGNAGPTAYAPFSASRGGVLAFREYDETAGRLAFRDRTGRYLDSALPAGSFVEFTLSPDGRRVAAAASGGKSTEQNIWMLDLARNTVSRLSFGTGEEASPVFSPDGAQIAYSSDRNGKSDVFVRAASGVGSDELVWKSDENKWPDDWTKDGKALLVESQSPRTQMDLWLQPLGGDRKPVPILTSAANESHSALSPDGKFFSYSSDETGRSEVYVQSFPPGGGKWQASTGGGDQALWRRDGKELFYLAGDGRLMAVPVSTSPTFSAGSPEPLFNAATGEITPSGIRNFYIPVPDGSKFLVLTYARAGQSNALHVLLNWTAGPESK